MKCTVEVQGVIRAMKEVVKVHKILTKRRKRDKMLQLRALGTDLFVTANEVTAGTLAEVTKAGGCVVAYDLLLQLLETYPPARRLVLEASERCLKLGSTSMPVLEYTKEVSHPAGPTPPIPPVPPISASPEGSGTTNANWGWEPKAPGR